MVSDYHRQAVEGLRTRFGSSYGPSDRELIQNLYRELLGKELRKTNCQNCYHDAVIELHLYIKRNSTTMNKAELKAGAVISCPSFHNGTIYTNKNLTDEVAREYLALFPNRKVLFAVLPSKAPKKVKKESESKDGEKAVKAKKTTKNEDK